jgi:hypothetical protein
MSIDPVESGPGCTIGSLAQLDGPLWVQGKVFAIDRGQEKP